MARSGSTSRAAAALAFLLGLCFGAGVFLGGYYELTRWAPIALAVLALALALAIGRPALPRGPAAVALGSLASLALVSLLSLGWAESADQALVDADRLLFYAALLAALLLALRGSGAAPALLAGIVAPLLALAAYLCLRLLGPDGPGLFLANRLNEPLNYVNGMGAYLLAAFWPLLALGERSRSAPLAGASVGAAALLVCLALLTQSRGALLALLASAALLLAIAPGRLRRGWALLVVAAGVGIGLIGLRDALAALPPDAVAPEADQLRTGVLAALAGAALAGLAWGVARALAARLGAVADAEDEERARLAARRRRISGAVLGALALVGVLALALPPAQRLEQVREQYEAFTELQPASAVDRFTSGGGNRYDYWRIALDEFADEPLRGVGAGNYDRGYYLERRSPEDVRQPHSIELQVLAETGLVGGLALAGFVGAVLAALWRRLHADQGEAAAGVALAAGGIFALWLAQTSVDWLHLIPGLSAIALAGAAILLEPWMAARSLPAAGGPSEAARARSLAARLALPAAAALAAGLAAVLIALPAIAERERERGYDRLAADPAAALADARDSLALNDESVPAYVLEAAALARLGDYRGARAALLEATRREPHDFVPWALLADLEARRGRPAAALALYRRASRLNPMDAGLAERARPPAPPPVGSAAGAPAAPAPSP